MAQRREKITSAPFDSSGAEDWLDGFYRELGRLVERRVSELEKQEPPAALAEIIPGFPVAQIGARLGITDLSAMEALIIACATVTDFEPHILEEAIASGLRSEGNHPRIGGIRGRDSRVFLPTCETLIFLASARTIRERLEIMRFFDEDHRLMRRKILSIEAPGGNEPVWASRIIPGNDLVDLLAGGKRRRPRPGADFPAERIDTDLQWEDLVLDGTTLSLIHELESWVKHGRALLDEWELRRRMRPGYRALFFGPPGTGKTLTASLLGRYTGRDVYRIDLSLVVSKFIGETEKNLSKVFAQAEDRDWILFFDEADALFGKRTQVRDAHDRYANQEVAYLLQRVETFEGLVILASNFRNNIDDAFLRRFQSVIHFPKPPPEQRLRIWRKMLPTQVKLEEQVNLWALCQKHELTGANVANIVQFACLQARCRGENILRLDDIQSAIDREYQKEGRVV